MIINTEISQAQAALKHVSVLNGCPSHPRPPADPPIQLRDLVLEPVPQVGLHPPQLPQLPQTETYNSIM